MKQQIGYIVIGLGIALGGFFIYKGIEGFATKDRYVTVKGLSERQVMADMAVWTLSYNITGNNLESLYEEMEPKKKALTSFLLENGITEDEIVYAPSTSEDRSEWYEWEKKKAYTDRFVLTGHLTIVSENVENLRQLQLRQTDLMKRGVILEHSYIDYDYTGLNDLKPEMVEEATRNARIVATKFAEDAKCKLGSIKNARQGQFEIYSDDVLPHMRNIRVVTNIEYYLK